MMAQEFFPQRVLASEERSGFYGRASLCALREKGQARARPAQCVTARHHNWTNKLLKINRLASWFQRPGEKCGLGVCAVERFRALLVDYDPYYWWTINWGKDRLPYSQQ